MNKFAYGIAPLVFLIGLMLLLGGLAGIFGINPTVGAIYFSLGLIATLWSARRTWWSSE